MDFAANTSGFNISAWLDNTHRPEYPKLNQSIEVDVCIIGGGIAGLTTAYRLIGEKKSVVVIDDGKIGSGETGRTSAHLTYVLDDRFYKIAKVHGEENARLAALSHAAAVDYIEEIVRSENIDCDFKRINGYLFPHHKKDIEILEKEYQLVSQWKLPVVFADKLPDDILKVEKCLVFPNQAQFHPIKYLSQLAECIVKKGGVIYENTHAKKFETGKSEKHKFETGKFQKDKFEKNIFESNRNVTVETNEGHIISAKNLVVATNVPINDRVIIHTKQKPVRTYVMGFLIPKDIINPALFWDTAEPYHYIRIIQGDYQHHQKPCDMLLIGGADHRTGEPPHSYEQCFQNIEAWAKNHFPQIIATIYRWSGQVIEPVDQLAFIGHNPLDHDNVYIATGDSGNGLTHGTIAGILISDLILNRNNEWQHLYKPARKSLKTLHQFIKTNLEGFLSYLNYFKKEHLTHPENLKAGEGALFGKGLNKVAAYKDEKGVLHECSAICPHLHSIVQWNSAEKTWDCPAHGSRFSGEGKAINGPTIGGLKKIKRIAPNTDK